MKNRHPAINLRVIVSICWLCSFGNVIAIKPPTVAIKNGTLEGTIMKSRLDKEFVAFRGIPYAQPPLDALRFEPPKPFDSWTGVRSATEDANICPQRNFFSSSENVFGDEDCLYLNVYSPKVPSSEEESARTNYPVMIWFHGGGFLSGTGHSAFYGPKFLLDHEIVLVTVNYRLGALGFLSTEDLAFPGNQGMKDQVQSMRWVRENIAAFGGDPNRVTIFGESAGGASVHYHMISPLSRGLFHRGISQSGTGLCPWAMTRPGNALGEAHRLGNQLNCPTVDTKALIDCLRKKDPVEIVSTDPPFKVVDAFPTLRFTPVIEPDHPGAFMKEEPVQSLKAGRMADVPWLTGINSHEGAIRVPAIFGAKGKRYDKLLDENFTELAPKYFLYEYTCPEEVKDKVTERIREFYLGDKKIDESTIMNLVDLFTDTWFYLAADNAIRYHLEALGSPIYYYYFTYKGAFSLSKFFGDPERDYGVSHADELQYIFPMGELLFPGTAMSEEDEKMVDVITHFWVNFAKSGNPTPEETQETPVKWKPVRTSNLEYLRINKSNDMGMAANLFPERVNFWSSIPYLGKIHGYDDTRIKDEF